MSQGPMETTRWYCRQCGIVRGLHAGTDIAWCHHGVTDVPATRMVVIPSSHPYAEGEALCNG